MIKKNPVITWIAKLDSEVYIKIEIKLKSTGGLFIILVKVWKRARSTNDKKACNASKFAQLRFRGKEQKNIFGLLILIFANKLQALLFVVCSSLAQT